MECGSHVGQSGHGQCRTLWMVGSPPCLLGPRVGGNIDDLALNVRDLAEHIGHHAFADRAPTWSTCPPVLGLPSDQLTVLLGRYFNLAKGGGPRSERKQLVV